MWNKIDQIISQFSLLKHPFYQAWQEGKLTKEDLRVYAKEYYHLESLLPRLISRTHSNAPDPLVRQELVKNLSSEEIDGRSHREMWIDFAEGLGISKREVIDSVPSEKTKEISNKLFDLTDSNDWKTGAMTLYTYESQQPTVAKSKKEGLIKHYGFSSSSDAVKFFDVHESLDVWHSQSEKEMISINAKVEDEKSLTETCEESARALWGFLDGVSEQIKLNDRVACAIE